MTEEQWACERATVIDAESSPALTHNESSSPRLPVNSTGRNGRRLGQTLLPFPCLPAFICVHSVVSERCTWDPARAPVLTRSSSAWATRAARYSALNSGEPYAARMMRCAAPAHAPRLCAYTRLQAAALRTARADTATKRNTYFQTMKANKAPLGCADILSAGGRPSTASCRPI
jgi:hypothetical protein